MPNKNKPQKKWLPSQETIQDHKSLKWISHLLHNPDLWHFNEKSLPRAMFIGLFFAFVPVPFQMLLAAAAAIPARANVALSVALVWITNPLTMPPLFYGTYKFGQLLLNSPNRPFPKDFTLTAILNELHHIWQPFLFGSLVAGLICATLGFVISRILWKVIAKKLEN